MKRSERYYNQARSCAFQSAALFMAAVAAACWIPGAIISNQQGASSIWLLLLIAATGAGLIAAFALGTNAMRAYRIGEEEQYHEARRAIRPRL
jgi:fatty acid desaturase